MTKAKHHTKYFCENGSNLRKRVNLKRVVIFLDAVKMQKQQKSNM